MTTKKSKAIVLSGREAPSERQQAVKDFLAPLFNDAQMRLLVNQTPAYAIMKRPGGGGKMLSYVKHGYVTDQLNKAFGFDWDLIIDPMANGQMYALEVEEIPLVDGKTGKPLPPKIIRHIAVCGHLVVRVHDSKGNAKGTITKSGFGSQIWHPAMEFGDALKAAKSDLLKVCAAQVGIALDLYWNDMDEVARYEDEQEKKQQQEIINALVKDIDESYPIDGVNMISLASAKFGFDGNKVVELLGKSNIPEAINQYKSSDWDIIMKAGNNGRNEAETTKAKRKK